MSTAKDFTKAIQDAVTSKTSAYDTTAEVRRVEGDTVWVHIPGGVDETPVKRTIDAKVGDTVQVRVGGGSAWLVGNASAPPTDDTRANSAMVVATDANALAESASKAATEAWGYAEDARSAAATAETHANEAKASAENASEYAARALGNLSTVQNVTETLNWITAHGTMTLTTDVALDPTHVYFVVDPLGDYEVGGTHYSVVTEPDVADIGTYYELTIDESLNNYVGTHLALTNEGLWLLPATSGTNKVLIATGAGSQYTIAGTYLIDASGNTVASFRADGATMSANGVQIAHLGYGAGNNSVGGTSNAPFYTFGIRRSGTVGNYSVAEGNYTEASGYGSHAEGNGTTASGTESHAEGTYTTASGYSAHAEGSNTRALDYYSHAEGRYTEANAYGAHAEGYGTIANGQYSHAEGYETYTDLLYSHAQNLGTIAARKGQTALGSFNVEDTSQTTTHPSDEALYGQYAVIVGNGTDDNSRSNALTVDWSGNVEVSGDITDGTGNVLSSKADTSAIPTATSDLLNDSGFISEDANGDISITRNITAGGDITDGTGNILSDKIGEDSNGDISVTNDITCGGDITCGSVVASGTVSGKRETIYNNAEGWTPSTSTGTTVDGKIANYSLVEVHLSDGSFGVCNLSWSNGTGVILGMLSYPYNDYIYVNSINFQLTASGSDYTLLVPSATQMPANYRIGTSVLKVTTVRKLTKIVGLVSTHE